MNGKGRIKIRVLVWVAMLAMILVYALPAQARDPLVFIPPQPLLNPILVNGITLKCSGPPFTVGPGGTCGPDTLNSPNIVAFGPPPAPFVCDIHTTVTDTTTGISVSAFECRLPTSPSQEPVCPPASQELGNESESGNVDLSGDITSSGDSSNQTAAPLDFGNTGSDQNAQGVLQTCGSTADDAQLQGGSMDFSPALNAPSDQGVGESSASQQG